MYERTLRLLALAMLLAAGGAAAAGATPNRGSQIVDENRDATADADWASRLKAKLADFEQASGIRVLVEFHAKSPPADEDQHPGDYMRALSAKLGVIGHGVLMVHFADDPDWRVWVGDDLTPKFVGKAGTAEGFTASGAMHNAKEAYLDAAMANAGAAYSALEGAKPDPKAAASGLLLRLQTDALVAGLRAKLAP